MKKTRKKSRRHFADKLVTRRGIVLIASLAAMILIVNIITASFSWFTPQEGKRMSYDTAYTLRSENCTFTTEVGKYWDYDVDGHDHFTGYIDYSSTYPNAAIPAGGTVYYRTIVQNSSEVLNPSNISLYIADFPANCSIGVQEPSNTFRTYTTAQQDLAIVRNAYVKTYVATDVDGPGRLYIDWFVVNNTTAPKSIDITGVYLVYN